MVTPFSRLQFADFSLVEIRDSNIYRNPKQIRNSKFKTKIWIISDFVLRIVSDFGTRISDLGVVWLLCEAEGITFKKSQTPGAACPSRRQIIPIRTKRRPGRVRPRPRRPG